MNYASTSRDLDDLAEALNLHGDIEDGWIEDGRIHIDYYPTRGHFEAPRRTTRSLASLAKATDVHGIIEDAWVTDYTIHIDYQPTGGTT